MEKEQILIRNAAKCRKCESIIESKHRHDWVACKCGAIFVDGGKDYVRAGADEWDNFISMVEYAEVPKVIWQ